LYFLNVLDDMAITEEWIILTLALNLLQQQGNILLHMQAVWINMFAGALKSKFKFHRYTRTHKRQ